MSNDLKYVYQRVGYRDPMKPNHKVVFYASLLDGPVGLVPVFYLRFVARDQSLYLIPKKKSGSIVSGINSLGTSFRQNVEITDDFHISFHESGVVNVTLGNDKYRIREANGLGPGPLFTVGVRRCHGDVEESPIDTRNIRPVTIGFVHENSTAYFSVFSFKLSEDKSTEPLFIPSLNVLEFILGFKEKDLRYRFVIWDATPTFEDDFMVWAGYPPGGIPDIRKKLNL